MSANALTWFMRSALFMYRAIKFRSVSSARWVDAYENFTPTHGK